jgi:hypothetical protein
MTKRKSKNPMAEAPAHRNNGKLTHDQASAPRSKPSRNQTKAAMTSAKTTAAESAPTSPVPTTAAESPAAASINKGTKRDKLSALDAAAKVLAETGQAMTCQEMIDAMAKKGYWTSPGGRTPAATLYSAILRELKSKGDQCRFVKTERGKFARK